MTIFWFKNWWLIMAIILILPGLSTFLFWYWIRRKSDLTVEVGVKCWDIFIKYISAFTIIISGALLFGKYIDQYQHDLTLREAEFLRQKISIDEAKHNQKQVLLSEAKRIVASYAAGNQEPKVILRFEELYSADLIGVQESDGPVEKAMTNFREKFKGHTNNDKTYLFLSKELSDAVQQELERSETKIINQYRELNNLLTYKEIGKLKSKI